MPRAAEIEERRLEAGRVDRGTRGRREPLRGRRDDRPVMDVQA
ncbi:MAG TPA: hypothetical protein VGI77_09200 [Gaiellaceae bacterium]